MNYWLNKSPHWSTSCLHLLQDVSTVGPPLNSNTHEIIKNSENFSLKFPIDDIQCKTLLSKINPEILDRNINSTYPVIHEAALNLCAKFLIFKQKNGTEIEKNLYGHMSLKGFIDRLLTKKAAVFTDSAYEFILSDGYKGSGDWEIIGTEQEIPPLELINCLSYDEMKLSCFISISSYSYFMNNGARNSYNNIEPRDNIQEEGVVVSLVGPKLTTKNLFEHQDVILSQESSTYINREMQEIFFDFYEEKIINYEDAKTSSQGFFTALRFRDLFNNNVYKKRLAVSLDTFLLEANYRAKENNTSAYVHLVGIGLGVWCISKHQEHQFVDVLSERLQFLGIRISNISDIHLSYFKETRHVGNIRNGDLFRIRGHPTGIRIHISKREPFTKLSDSRKLLVVSYAADGNSLPGNTFWKGFLGNSGDSATASSSQVAELQNPHINPLVCAANLKVVTVEGTLVPLSEFAEILLEQEYEIV